jgi:hypothetical protein
MAYIKQILFSTLALTLVNCSGVKFGTVGGETQSSASASSTDPGKTPTGDDGASGSITQPGAPGSTPATGTGSGSGAGAGTANPAALPKIQFIGPPCKQQSLCMVRFVLDAPVSGVFEFDWKTNDTLFQTPEPAGATYQYAQPAVHYISTSGHAVFQPGEIEKDVYVQNINPYSYEIVIGIRMSVCQYNTALGNCTSFFH